MQEYIHRTRHEMQDDAAADANGMRLLNGIAIAMFAIVAGAMIYATAYSPHRSAQDVILNDFATLNLATAEQRVPVHAASLPSASRFE